MGIPEERAYSRFEGQCFKCGREVVYGASFAIHPEWILCEECEQEAKELREALREAREWQRSISQ